MKRSVVVRAWKMLAPLSLVLLMGNHCDWHKEEKAKEPKFEEFFVNSSEICTNFGVPIFRVGWKVVGSGESCLNNVRLNGIAVDRSLWSFGSDTCQEDNYDESISFSLRDVYNNNIPQSLTVEADLTGPFVLGGGAKVFDSSTATGTARECQGGFTPGN